MNSSHTCTWCQNSFDNPKNSITKKQVIWVRMWIQLFGNLVFVHGAICGKCRNELEGYQVSPMTLQKLTLV